MCLRQSLSGNGFNAVDPSTSVFTFLLTDGCLTTTHVVYNCLLLIQRMKKKEKEKKNVQTNM
jgi:hypothetical protein